MNSPLVSIIIPTYNRAPLISETLDCLLDQTYQNWECIIVDDGSTDNTKDIIEGYVIQDSRIQYHQRPDNYKSGGNGARNYGFKLSKGEYINWLDSDDLISPNKLEYQVASLSQNDTDVSISEWLFFINKENISYNESYSYQDFNTGIELLNYLGINSTYIPIHAYLTKSKIINLSGLWNNSLKINQDGEFMTRVLLHANKVKFVEGAYALYRKSTYNNTSSYNREKLPDLIKSWELISCHCSHFVKKNQNIYVLSAKRRIFSNLRNDYPLFVLKKILFFREIIIELIVNKIKIKFRR
jgi:glycosyltransferase involved in cell wall biosynthesis